MNFKILENSNEWLGRKKLSWTIEIGYKVEIFLLNFTCNINTDFIGSLHKLAALGGITIYT